MKTNYFESAKTLDEAKKIYWSLAKIHHPDKGGNVETMKEINAQFESFSPASEKFQGEKEQWSAKEYSKIISALINVPEIVVEIIGSFIWVSGNSKPYKEQIKAVEVGESYKKAMWHKTKNMWFFSPTGYRKFTKANFNIDQIRGMYGSEIIEKSKRPTLAE